MLERNPTLMPGARIEKGSVKTLGEVYISYADEEELFKMYVATFTVIVVKYLSFFSHYHPGPGRVCDASPFT
jgi:hypothetical protein